MATDRARSLAYVLLNWGVIVAMFLASDYVYLANFPHWQCSAILAAMWVANWKAFDSTKQARGCQACLGFNLAYTLAVCAVRKPGALLAKRVESV